MAEVESAWTKVSEQITANLTEAFVAGALWAAGKNEGWVTEESAQEAGRLWATTPTIPSPRNPDDT